MLRALYRTQWMRTINLSIAVILFAIACGLIAFGLLFGLFGGLNDGITVGLEILLHAAGFGLACLAAGSCFLAIARAHGARSPRRWWLQVLLPIVAWSAFLFAAAFSSIVDKLDR